jgi:Rrf2 family protein
MKLSAREEYGLRCLLQIARAPENSPCTIHEITRAEGLTPHNVAKLLRILRRAGFVKSLRGQTGGYVLTKPPKDILVRDVLRALGGHLYDSRFCKRYKGKRNLCAHDLDCSLRSLWARLQNAVDSALEAVTLADLISPDPPALVRLSPKPPPSVRNQR